MGKLQFYDRRTLKLSNVLKYTIMLSDEDLDLNIAIEQMKSYIRAKGTTQMGPLIQYTRTYFNDRNEMEIEVTIMLQCNNFLHNIGQPYSMEPIIRVTNALYCQYIGPKSSLQFAYDKINLEAFENDIAIDGCSYTIFVSNNVEDDIMVADVFMPRLDKG